MFWIGFLIELVLLILVLFCGLTLIFLLTMSWSWAQQNKTDVSMAQMTSVAANEWAAFLGCFVLQLIPIRHFHEAPPLNRGEAAPQQLPVIFIPSLHTRSGLFYPFYFKLKALFFNSLWFFDWKFFLKDPELMEDELTHFIQEVLKKTQAHQFRCVSFGSSRPIVAKVLEKNFLSSYCDSWVALSSPTELGSFQKKLLSERMKKTYDQFKSFSSKKSDLAYYGRFDLFFTESSLSHSSLESSVLDTGHFGCLFELQMLSEVAKVFSEKSGDLPARVI